MKSEKIKVKICDKEIEIRKIRSVAIKAYCTDCSAGNRTEVKECPCTQCPLYCFRGYIAWTIDKENRREMSEEQKNAVRDRFKKARETGK
jgi:hypothetical protein